MNEQEFNRNESERKNSYQKVNSSKKKLLKHKKQLTHKNRTSIATALSKRMKEHVFKS